MAEFFIRRPIVAMVISILTVIVGLISLSRLPIAEYPQVSPTLIQVTTTYRGAAAEAVMESVATPIESKVNGVDKLLYLQSYNANDGKMTLNVTFDVGTDVDIMQVNTQNRVGQAEAQLPDAVKREGVVVNRSSPDILMVIGLLSPKGAYDATFLGNYADINLADAIKRVPGVGDVKNFTAQDYSMRVWLRPDKLATLGLTPQDVASAIQEQNAQSPAGSIGAEPAPPGQESQLNLRALGLLREPKQFEEIIVRSNPDGSQVKIKDVGRVELGAQTYAFRARLNKAPAAVLGVYLAPGANALQTAELVHGILENARTRFPADMEYDITLDSTLPIKASMDEIVHTLFEAILLVLLVVFIFLQSSMQLQDRSGGGVEQLAGYVRQLTAAAAERPEIGRISTTFPPTTPQVRVELDREKARTLGVPVDSVFQTMQAYLSGLYVNDFVRILLGRNPGPIERGHKLGDHSVRAHVPAGLPSDLLERLRTCSSDVPTCARPSNNSSPPTPISARPRPLSSPNSHSPEITGSSPCRWAISSPPHRGHGSSAPLSRSRCLRGDGCGAT